jgi:DNA-binding transcriptional MerR regulator
MYRILEFVRRAGVTVRTLHYYDRVGVLRPKRRTRSGYRLYDDADFRRLEQIVVLKFLGLPLNEIARVLDGKANLVDVLTTQHQQLSAQWKRVSTALNAIDHIRKSIERGPLPDWPQLAAIVSEIGMENDAEALWKKHELEAARKIIFARRLAWDATLTDYELSRDVRAAIVRGDTPESAAGQLLVARWRDATERFVGGDDVVRAALRLVMNDRTNWPDMPDSAAFMQYFDRALDQAS